MQIDHFVLTVKNIEETLNFYKKVLGAELIDYELWKAGQIRYPSMLFSLQKIVLHSDVTAAQPKAKNPSCGSADICFLWEGNISSAIDHLAFHGIPIELGPVERVGTHGKGKSIYFRDPEGNLLELISYLP